ncbi:ceramide kinase [Protopterus annectens]|uniref:ceramide kinase n=1 Tax=Protopterus annectens TaxID=7888 RepID=UPI001CFB172C|nr:ceramide kinase [Protopterus annectens]
MDQVNIQSGLGTCLEGTSVLNKTETCYIHTVPVSEIIAVREIEIDEHKDDGKWQKISKPMAFKVYFVRRARQHRWRCSEVKFCSNNEQLCNQWVQALREQLDKQTCRPKRLIVYINPFGGKKQGKKIYERKVAPLFSLASISTDVIVTEWANQAKESLLKGEVDLDMYDGIVSVGGDGMFSEIMHGVIGRTQKNLGIDQNDSKSELAPCNIRIGIIPAGSTDCVCYATVGVVDPVTSALHIIVGDGQPLDVSSIHHNNSFLKYSVSLLGYGFYGDILTDSEKNRWMGPTRYDISGVKTFFAHHSYEGTLSFLPSSSTLASPRDNSRCKAGCYVCWKSGQQLPLLQEEETHNVVKRNEDKEAWKIIRGKFLAINAANMSCACPRSPKGLSPSAHLADGCTDLIVVHKCSRLEFLRHLFRHTSSNDQFDLTFVEVHRVEKFRFTPKHLEDEDSDIRDIGKKLFGQICRDHPACGCSSINSIWNCDGEVLDGAAIEVRVHCQLIKLFARGIEQSVTPENIQKSCAV